MELNYYKLTLSLFVAITISSLLVDGIEAYIANQVLLEASEKIKIESEKVRAEMLVKSEEAKRIYNENIRLEHIKTQKRQNEIKKLNAIRKTNDETCAFWTKEYRENRTEYKEQMKKSACTRAMND